MASASVSLKAGAPVPPDVERHLFEPFFSTRSRGSGLGLYICRELCERYGARIDYRRHEGAAQAGNEFILSLCRSAVARYFASGGSSGKRGGSTRFTVGGQISKTFDYPRRGFFGHRGWPIRDNQPFTRPTAFGCSV